GTPGDVADRQRGLDRMRLALDDARPRDQQERRAISNRETGNLDPVHDQPATDWASARRVASLCLWLASTNPAKSGCGFSGFDLNSGWNWTAMYQGCDGSSMISTNLPSTE